MFRFGLLSCALLLPLPAYAAGCNLHEQLTGIGLLTARLHLKVTVSRHNEMSKIIAERLQDIRDIDAQGFESAACDRAESLMGWIQRESAPQQTNTQR